MIKKKGLGGCDAGPLKAKVQNRAVLLARAFDNRKLADIQSALSYRSAP